jgi:hypothetical protein
MEPEFQYDAILSHSAKDKPAVCPVAKRLRNNWLKQFTYRYNTADNHILKVFSETWAP